MDIRSIDRSALSGRSGLHRASASAKLAALFLVLIAVVASWNVLILAAITFALIATVIASRLDVRLALSLAGYPALFAAVFALASAPSLLSGTTIVVKAMTAALAAVTLILTTPYPQVFAHVQRIMPGLAGDAMLMTYRTFFLLADRFSDMLRAVRLRSGTGPGRSGVVRTSRMVGSALGSLVLYAVELAERDYDVLYVRGYEGRLRAAVPQGGSLGGNVLVVAGAGLIALTAIVWRLGWSSLNPYSWLPAGLAMMAILAAAIWRSLRGKSA